MYFFRILGNILWHIPFCGFLTALFVFVLGLLLTASVIAAPIGLGLLQYSKFLLLPFSYDMVSKNDIGEAQNPVWRAYSFLLTLVYLPFGLIALIIGLFQAVGLALTIVGIPTALVVVKSLGTFLNPVGKVCVPTDAMAALRRKLADQKVCRA